MSRQWLRRSSGAGALVIAVVAVAVTTACMPPAPTPSPSAASPSSAPASSPTDVVCGSGFGGGAADSAIGDSRPIWSEGWSGVPEGTTPYVMEGPDGTRWFTAKAPITVAAHSGGDVQVVAPDSARVLVSTAAVWGHAQEADLLSGMSVRASLPTCDALDAYPSLVLAPEQACVTLRIAPHGLAAYEVEVPVGANCP